MENFLFSPLILVESSQSWPEQLFWPWLSDNIGKRMKLSFKSFFIECAQDCIWIYFYTEMFKGNIHFSGKTKIKTFLKLGTVPRNLSLKKNIFRNACNASTNKVNKNNFIYSYFTKHIVRFLRKVSVFKNNYSWNFDLENIVKPEYTEQNSNLPTWGRGQVTHVLCPWRK